MTEEQKRIKIAEACGFKRTEWPYVCWYNPEHILCDEGHTITDPEDFPDYFNDLNAIHEARKALPESLQFTYWCYLGGDISDSGWTGGWEMIDASASQHAEAFGLTLGLWKEGE